MHGQVSECSVNTELYLLEENKRAKTAQHQSCRCVCYHLSSGKCAPARSRFDRHTFRAVFVLFTCSNFLYFLGDLIKILIWNTTSQETTSLFCILYEAVKVEIVMFFLHICQVIFPNGFPSNMYCKVWIFYHQEEIPVMGSIIQEKKDIDGLSLPLAFKTALTLTK